MEDVDLARGDKVLLTGATWRLGAGDRVGIVGVNGAGKTSLLQLLAGTLAPSVGRVKHGRTVTLQHLTQQLDDLDPQARVLPTVESIRRIAKTADGEISASSLLERFGFTGDRLTARLGDLSGGERRRFQLLRILLTEPNVLLLDEPTNDLDIETLNVMEDFLDSWPGTLVVVTHDRYFLERVTDSVWALLGDGQVSMLPRGVDEYLERRSASLASATPSGGPVRASVQVAKAKAGSADERAARKQVERLDKQLARLAARDLELQKRIAESADDYVALAGLSAELDVLHARARRPGIAVARSRRGVGVAAAACEVSAVAVTSQREKGTSRPRRSPANRR